jgi:hypothetical protein
MAQTVDPQMAQDCIQQYNKMYLSINAADAVAVQKAYTASISFSFESLLGFINGCKGSADTLEIKFGVYTQAFADQYGVTAGRLTVFLYTKNKGGGGVGNPPNDVFNVGEPTP